MHQSAPVVEIGDAQLSQFSWLMGLAELPLVAAKSDFGPVSMMTHTYHSVLVETQVQTCGRAWGDGNRLRKQAHSCPLRPRGAQESTRLADNGQEWAGLGRGWQMFLEGAAPVPSDSEGLR